jgi:hypothetical protein
MVEYRSETPLFAMPFMSNAFFYQDRLGTNIGKAALKKEWRVSHSCHDTNLLAFASLLGVDVGAPYFTGHWIVELHCGPGGEWTTHVIYNQDPTAMGIKEFVGCQPVKLPLNGEYCKLSDCSVGAQPAEELIDYLDKRSVYRSSLSAGCRLPQTHHDMCSTIVL